MVSTWNRDLRLSGIMERPLDDAERLQPFSKGKSMDEIFFLFATLRELSYAMERAVLERNVL